MNTRNSMENVKDQVRQLMTYLRHPDTDIRVILGAVGLLCLIGWYLIKGEWPMAVLITGVVSVLALSFCIFGELGILILNAIRKDKLDWKLVRKATIMSAILVTILVVFDVPLNMAVTVIVIMGLRAVLYIVVGLLARK